MPVWHKFEFILPQWKWKFHHNKNDIRSAAQYSLIQKSNSLFSLKKARKVEVFLLCCNPDLHNLIFRFSVKLRVSLSLWVGLFNLFDKSCQEKKREIEYGNAILLIFKWSCFSLMFFAYAHWAEMFHFCLSKWKVELLVFYVSLNEFAQWGTSITRELFKILLHTNRSQLNAKSCVCSVLEAKKMELWS